MCFPTRRSVTGHPDHIVLLITDATSVLPPVARHEPALWLVNTGWTGGSFTTGERISIDHARALLWAITSGALTGVETLPEAGFGLEARVSIPDVPDEVLRPRDAWDDPDAYDAEATRLRKIFQARADEQGIEARWLGWQR